MSFTNYLDQKLVQLAHGDVSWSPPATVYVGLSTTTPTAAGANVSEPSGGGYARVAVTNNTTDWVPLTTQPAAGYSVENGIAITWPTASASWGTVTNFVIYDASTGGNLLEFGALGTAVAIGSGTTASFPVDALTITND